MVGKKMEWNEGKFQGKGRKNMKKLGLFVVGIMFLASVALPLVASAKFSAKIDFDAGGEFTENPTARITHRAGWTAQTKSVFDVQLTPTFTWSAENNKRTWLNSVEAVGSMDVARNY
ncbi:MAG TPA: hypothetical protein VJB34_02930, partial [Bdellovibrionota bacterium]|nr:hypothetical protein [Bdellovibrionota bacterium]